MFFRCRNGGSHGVREYSFRVGSLGSPFHIGKLITQSRHTKVSEPFRYHIHKLMAHPGTRAMRENKTSVRIARPHQQTGYHAGFFIYRKVNFFCCWVAHRYSNYNFSTPDCLRCSFQPATRYQSAMRTTTPQTALAQPIRCGRNNAEPKCLIKSVLTRNCRIVDAPTAKKSTATQSLQWPSPARQIEPAPQPPASTMPAPKRIPPNSAPSQNDGKTHSVASFKSVAFRIVKPI